MVDCGAIGAVVARYFGAWGGVGCGAVGLVVARWGWRWRDRAGCGAVGAVVARWRGRGWWGAFGPVHGIWGNLYL